MSAVNPYAPPRAAVADVDDSSAEVQPVRMWSSQGRIGRLRFLAYLTGSYLLFTFLGGALAALLGAAGLGLALGVIAVVGVVAYLAFTISKGMQRSHDMGWTGWTVLLMFIPLVGLVWIFNPGTAGANRFGAPPPANTLGVKILAFLFPVVMVVGILAAIALPAYQGYVKRADAAQMK
jgi:uncharacterized membrane protein YhaH (DUF805 family)